jgi:hypothetical protein
VIFFGHHDDDPQYRFGLLPQPLKACPRQRAETSARVPFSATARFKDRMNRPIPASGDDVG